MKKLMAVLVTVALAVTCGAAFAQEPTAEWLDELDAMIVRWEELYSQEFGWAPEDPPVNENMSVPLPGELTWDEALVIAVQEVCAMRGSEDLTYFEKHRPFFGFTSERNWVVSLLAVDPLNDPAWAYWVTVDAGTGEMVDFRRAEPMDPSTHDLSDEPKG